MAPINCRRNFQFRPQLYIFGDEINFVPKIFVANSIFCCSESNPFKVIPLLGDSSPCRGNIFFQVHGAFERRLILEADFEESRVVALMFWIICIRIVNFNMYVY